MVQARIHQGRIEVLGPIPDSWEGQIVKIVPMTPEDPLPDLESQLAALHEMGAMELEGDERDRISRDLTELNRLSKEAMRRRG